ncbi:hypothetical protein LRS11_05170 [Pseudomonas sp. J452]|uniref:hypothetical protein n=1 Tax=Pseudomonas sp. J452 TaxID=2898441 RepID=UPI0021AD6776|nr:hypothetical protein [Pseudomonas sp. J452]UUY09431.1 hypothetical protein LRS11_05170 [Pseudomonas sp. J452]
MTVIVSIAAKNYLPRVRVLAASLQTWHPELSLHVLLADELAGELDPASEPYRLVTLDELQMADQRQFCFRYDIKQRAAALKPYFLQHLLDQGHQHVLFIDPDMLVTASLAPLLEPLQQHAILLTPHLLHPASGQLAAQRELEILRAGMFNAGVIGVSASAQGQAFLAWWRQRLALHAQDSVAEGMYYDQRWLDLVPGLFDQLYVVRDAGCNVAHWNLGERPLEWRNAELLCAKQLCRLIHFSGYDPNSPERLSYHADWIAPDSGSPLAALLEDYRQRLLVAGQAQVDGWRTAWEHFDNGLTISPILRKIFAANATHERFGDPFHCGQGSFFQWLCLPVDDQQPPLSNLWDSLIKLTPALQKLWPDHLGADRQAFLDWVSMEGATTIEYRPS